ncbi:hypothetical protein WA026_005647, partial [Henosepilachna vigintioctopunctata]
DSARVRSLEGHYNCDNNLARLPYSAGCWASRNLRVLWFGLDKLLQCVPPASWTDKIGDTAGTRTLNEFIVRYKFVRVEFAYSAAKYAFMCHLK